MKVFAHHIYEYKKGLRNLILHTISSNHRAEVERRLAKDNIDYIIQELRNGNINVFFGAKECVEVIRKFGMKKLNKYTPEEDFILGVLLGYSPLIQCERYLFKTGKEKHNHSLLKLCAS